MCFVINIVMSIINKVLRRVFPTKQAKRVKPWMQVNGDKTLRLNYDLSENSIVFDLGGYEGQWASDIFSKYKCKIFVFEPYKDYAKNIRTRFLKNNSIKVFDFGLGKEDKNMTLYSNHDGSSVFKKTGLSFEIEIKKATLFIRNQDLSFIDLMKINIEGGEYDLLEELIDSGMIKSINNVQVQFHDFVPDAYARMKKIHALLEKTHQLTYSYEFVWENWQLKV
jgi:FkbM family methyltransferase